MAFTVVGVVGTGLFCAFEVDAFDGEGVSADFVDGGEDAAHAGVGGGDFEEVGEAGGHEFEDAVFAAAEDRVVGAAHAEVCDEGGAGGDWIPPARMRASAVGVWVWVPKQDGEARWRRTSPWRHFFEEETSAWKSRILILTSGGTWARSWSTARKGSSIWGFMWSRPMTLRTAILMPEREVAKVRPLPGAVGGGEDGEVGGSDEAWVVEEGEDLALAEGVIAHGADVDAGAEDFFEDGG